MLKCHVFTAFRLGLYCLPKYAFRGLQCLAQNIYFICIFVICKWPDFYLKHIICYGYSKEPSQCDGSFEHPEHMLNMMCNQNIYHCRLEMFVYLNL